MKTILDPSCGSKMFWFDKNNDNVVFGDVRKDVYANYTYPKQERRTK